MQFGGQYDVGKCWRYWMVRRGYAPNAAGLKSVSDEREGKVSKVAAPVFWTVGMDEIPTG